MKRSTKLRIVMAISVVFGLAIFYLSFMVYAFSSDGRTFAETLAYDEGGSAFIQLFLSAAIIVFGLFAFTLKMRALQVLKVSLLMTFVNVLVSTLFWRFRFVDLLNPILWLPIIIFGVLELFTRQNTAV